MDLRCSEKWTIGLFGSIYFSGYVLGTTFLARFGDTRGRAPLIRVGQGVTLACYVVIVFFTRNITVIYLLLFLMGILACCRSNLAFIYGQELVLSEQQIAFGTFVNASDCSVMLFSALFIMCVSRDWVQLHSVFVGLVALSFLGFCRWLPESPRFLVASGRYAEAREAYARIAEINARANVDLSKIVFDDEVASGSKSDQNDRASAPSLDKVSDGPY